MKIVINTCFGGFSLSYEAVHAYAKLKGLQLYPERRDLGNFCTYWTVPEKDRPKELDWRTATIEQRIAYNTKYEEIVLSDRDIPRDDLDLIKVVEQLKGKAGGNYAKLSIVEIPDNVLWEIDEYDGNESVVEQHRSWA